jgi:hypothetical protein
VQALAREYTVVAIKTLASCLEDPKLRLQAACALLDRGWGRPVQAVAGDSNTPLLIDFRWSDELPVQPGAVATSVIEGVAPEGDAEPILAWGNSC